MGNPASLRRSQRPVSDEPSKPLDRDDPAIKARIELYIQAFLGTEQESDPELQRASIAAWLKSDEE